MKRRTSLYRIATGWLHSFFLIATLIVTSYTIARSLMVGGTQHPQRPKDDVPWNPVNFTPISHPIAFKAGSLVNTGLAAGDAIGVFTPEGLCAGMVVLQNNTQPTAIMAFADDETTPEKDGFSPGELFLFKAYKVASKEEINLNVTYDPSLPNTSQFAPQGLSAVIQVEVAPVTTGDLSEITIGIYPNPSSGLYQLALSYWPEELQIQVIDTKGNLIQTFTPGKRRNGSSYPLNLQHLPNGVYHLKFLHAGSVQTQKIVKN